MTGLTFHREGSNVSLLLMDVVAGAAGERFTLLKTAAAFQKLDLVAVNIDALTRRIDGESNVFQ